MMFDLLLGFFFRIHNNKGYPLFSDIEKSKVPVFSHGDVILFGIEFDAFIFIQQVSFDFLINTLNYFRSIFQMISFGGFLFNNMVFPKLYIWRKINICKSGG